MNNAALYDFCKKTPPAAMRSMPSSLVIRKDISGTAVEFLLRAYYEAVDILDRGDSLVKDIPFEREDIIPLLNGCDTLLQYMASGQIDDAGFAVLQKAQKALATVSLYHEAKIEAATAEIERLSLELSKVEVHFNAARAAGNVKALLEYYPHLPALLDLDNQPDDRFEQESSVTDLSAKREEIQNQGVLEGTISEALAEGSDGSAFIAGGVYAPLSFIQMMGKPKAIEDKEDSIYSYRKDIDRNGRVLEALQLVSDDFFCTLNSRVPNSAYTAGSSNVVRLEF